MTVLQRGSRGSGVTPQVGVIGAGLSDRELDMMAEEVGALIAARGWTLVCGGLGGVMESASRGAASRGGLVVGLLPGSAREEGNRYLTVSLPTGMGHGRNVLVAQSSDALIAVGGGFGTLSEMALGLKMGKPVISLRSWAPDPAVRSVQTPREAVDEAARSLGIGEQ